MKTKSTVQHTLQHFRLLEGNISAIFLGNLAFLSVSIIVVTLLFER